MNRRHNNDTINKCCLDGNDNATKSGEEHIRLMFQENIARLCVWEWCGNLGPVGIRSHT